MGPNYSANQYAQLVSEGIFAELNFWTVPLFPYYLVSEHVTTGMFW